MDYMEFIRGKIDIALETGINVPKEELHSGLFDWQRDIVHWALKKGRAALFEDCGLGKTIQQLEWSQHVWKHSELPVLIVAPLAVAEQTRREGEKFGYNVAVCRNQMDVKPGINICNYEMLEHFDPKCFSGVVLDESSILKNYAGKLRNTIIDMFRSTPYKLSCTATPSPNDYMELGNQAEFLGILSRTEMLSMFFIHDGSNTSKCRLKGHARSKFWQWIASWAVMLATPRDLGYSGDGYDLPEKVTEEHIVSADGFAADDSLSFFTREAKTLTERRQARAYTVGRRCQEAARLVEMNPSEQWLIWCDLNIESETLRKMIPGAVEIRGSDSVEDKTARLEAFSSGKLRCLITKPSIAGFGLNWQNCSHMIFVGLSDSFEMMYQAIRRCWRFGQKNRVYVHIITSEAEGAVRENIIRKEEQAQEMISEMVLYTRELLAENIHGTVKEKSEYRPEKDMKIPEWLRSAA